MKEQGETSKNKGEQNQQSSSMERPSKRVFTAPKKAKKRMSKGNKPDESNRGRTRTSGKMGYQSKTGMDFFPEEKRFQETSPYSKFAQESTRQDPRPYTTKAQLRRILTQEKKKYMAIGQGNRSYGQNNYEMFPKVRQSKTRQSMHPLQESESLPYMNNVSNRMIQKMGRTGGPQVDDIQSVQAKQLFHDKERMYEERLHLQQKVNNLNLDNLKLRTQLKNITKEATKFENLFVQVSVPKKKRKKQRNLENCLTVELRKQNKELKTNLDHARKLIERLKRKVKYTKIEELESQVQAFEAEAIRLRHLLTQTVRQKIDQAAGPITQSRKSSRSQIRYARDQAEKVIMQTSLINTLQHDNQLLAQSVKSIQEMLQQNKLNSMECERNLNKQRKQNGNLIKKNKKLQQKIRDMAGDDWDGTGEVQNTKKAKIKQQLDRLERECKTMKIEREDFIQQIKKLNANLLEEKERTEKRLKLSNLQFQADVDEVKKHFEEEHEQLRQESEHWKRIAQSTDQGSPTRNVQLKSPEKVAQVQQKPEVTKVREPTLKYKKVLQEDITEVLKFLRLKLISNYTSILDLKKIFEAKAVNGKLSIKSLEEVFQNKPFCLGKQDLRARLMARFLVEDNGIEIVRYDDTLTSDTFMINSILKNILNNYKLYTIEQEEQLHKEIKYFLDKYDIKDNFKQIPIIKKTGKAMPIHIRQVIQEILQKEYKIAYGEYIVAKILRNANKFEDMEYEYMFEYFKNDFSHYREEIVGKQNRNIQEGEQNAENQNGQEGLQQDEQDQIIQEIDLENQENAELE